MIVRLLAAKKPLPVLAASGVMTCTVTTERFTRCTTARQEVGGACGSGSLPSGAGTERRAGWGDAAALGALVGTPSAVETRDGDSSRVSITHNRAAQAAARLAASNALIPQTLRVADNSQQMRDRLSRFRDPDRKMGGGTDVALAFGSGTCRAIDSWRRLWSARKIGLGHSQWPLLRFP